MNCVRIRPVAVGLALFQPTARTTSSAAIAAIAATSATPTLPLRTLSAAFSSSPSLAAKPTSTLTAPASEPVRRMVPSPVPFVPDVATFLLLIGRNMKQHTTKFPTWEALFTLTSQQLKELGVEPPRDRRYLLRWLERFRAGRLGIGGDFRYVRDGVAQLRMHEVVDAQDPTQVYKTVVNVPAQAEEAAEGADKSAAITAPTAAPDQEGEPVRVSGYKIVGAHHIAGPYALPLKQNSGAQVTQAEGMWEKKRGRKIDGGERRQKEVRFKRGVAQRKAAREQAMGR